MTHRSILGVHRRIAILRRGATDGEHEFARAAQDLTKGFNNVRVGHLLFLAAAEHLPRQVAGVIAVPTSVLLLRTRLPTSGAILR